MPRLLRALLLLLTLTLTLACRRPPQGVNAPVNVIDIVVSSSSERTEIVLHEEDQAPRVGDTYTKAEMVLSEQIGTFSSGSRSARLFMEVREREVSRTEVLAVRGAGVTKWRLTFSELDKVMTANTNPLPGKPKPSLGKTYIIDLEKRPTLVTDDQGTPVPEAERAAA